MISVGQAPCCKVHKLTGSRKTFCPCVIPSIQIWTTHGVSYTWPLKQDASQHLHVSPDPPVTQGACYWQPTNTSPWAVPVSSRASTNYVHVYHHLSLVSPLISLTELGWSDQENASMTTTHIATEGATQKTAATTVPISPAPLPLQTDIRQKINNNSAVSFNTEMTAKSKGAKEQILLWSSPS